MSKEVQKTKGNKLKENSLKGGLDKLGANLNALSQGLGKIELPRLFYQLVIFLIDGSGSMHGKSINNLSKAQEIDNSLRLIIERLQKSKNKNSFDIAFIPFANGFDSSFGVKNITKIGINESFNPFDYNVEASRTFLEEALIYVEGISNNYLQENREKNTQVLIQILSDGAINDFPDIKKVINNIKNNGNITIACQFIETDIEKQHERFKKVFEEGAKKLKSLASNEDLFITSPDPEEIRKHMIKSISTVSKID